MSFNDQAVITAAGGYIFTAPVGTARPTPAELNAIDPARFGAQVNTLAITGNPTGGTFTYTVNGEAATIPYNATAAVVQQKLEALEKVGSGNVLVTGTSLPTGPLEISWVGKLQGRSPGTISTTATALTGGTTPAVTNTVKTALNGWDPAGHTSREDMPEFGYEGGDTEVRGTWQNAQLREVTSEQPADYLTMFLHQFDTSSFEMYYGEDDSETPGVFGVAGGNSTPIERAMLVIIVDGVTRIGFYTPKASIRRDDAIGLPVDSFATLPVRASFLKHGANNLFEWISEDLFD
ncbi:phage tail tube protein [Prescottella equi]